MLIAEPGSVNLRELALVVACVSAFAAFFSIASLYFALVAKLQGDAPRARKLFAAGLALAGAGAAGLWFLWHVEFRLHIGVG